MTDQKKQEFTLRISQANQSQLVVILYELFFYYVEQAETSFTEGDMSGYVNGLNRAHDCLNELIASLRYEQELAQTLLKFYFYVSARIGAAIGSRKTELLKDPKRLMMRHYEIYKRDAQNDTSGPVMGHAQTVYAGLTYGKNDLIVNREDGNGSRGFYA